MLSVASKDKIHVKLRSDGYDVGLRKYQVQLESPGGFVQRILFDNSMNNSDLATAHTSYFSKKGRKRLCDVNFIIPVGADAHDSFTGLFSNIDSDGLWEYVKENAIGPLSSLNKKYRLFKNNDFNYRTGLMISLMKKTDEKPPEPGDYDGKIIRLELIKKPYGKFSFKI